LEVRGKNPFRKPPCGVANPRHVFNLAAVRALPASFLNTFSTISEYGHTCALLRRPLEFFRELPTHDTGGLLKFAKAPHVVVIADYFPLF
jgi:hypothetical protein